MKKIAWIDCETGGLDAKEHDITQVAGIIEINGKVVEEFEILMRPDSPSRVTAEALAVTKQTIEQVMAHPSTQAEGYWVLTKILARYVDKYNKADKFVWAGQNPRFDMDFVRALWKKNQDQYFGSWFWPNPADLIGLTMAMTIRGHLPGLPNLRLHSVAEALKVPLDAHKAIEDVRATRTCFYKLAERIPAQADGVPA